MGDLLIAFARISRAQFVDAFEVVRMEDISGGADDFPLEDEVAFVRCQQVAAAVGQTYSAYLSASRIWSSTAIQRGAVAPPRQPW
jgi:hypothetical protein